MNWGASRGDDFPSEPGVIGSGSAGPVLAAATETWSSQTAASGNQSGSNATGWRRRIPCVDFVRLGRFLPDPGTMSQRGRVDGICAPVAACRAIARPNGHHDAGN